MKKRVYRTTARLSDNQQYVLACFVREGRKPYVASTRTINSLVDLGLLEFCDVDLGGGVIGGKWRPTQAGIDRVHDGRLYITMTAAA